MIDAKLLASDRLLDQAWRGGIGVASALARAQALGDPLRCRVVIEDAKLIVSAHHACSPDEALARLVFVSKHTNRRLIDIAHDVVTCAAGQDVEGDSTPPVYRFTLKTRKQVPTVFRTDRKCSNPRCPVFRKATRLLVCRRCHRATAVSVYRPHTT